MKKAVKSVTAILLICVFVVSLFGCGEEDNESKIKDRLNTFADAYNSGDTESMIECFDSDTKSALSMVTGLGDTVLDGLNSLTGMDVSVKDILHLGLGVSGIFKGDNLKIKSVKNIKISDNTATADVTMSYDNDKSNSKKTTVAFTKEDGDWYIKTFK